MLRIFSFFIILILFQPRVMAVSYYHGPGISIVNGPPKSFQILTKVTPAPEGVSHVIARYDPTDKSGVSMELQLRKHDQKWFVITKTHYSPNGKFPAEFTGSPSRPSMFTAIGASPGDKNVLNEMRVEEAPGILKSELVSKNLKGEILTKVIVSQNTITEEEYNKILATLKLNQR